MKFIILYELSRCKLFSLANKYLPTEQESLKDLRVKLMKIKNQKSTLVKAAIKSRLKIVDT